MVQSSRPGEPMSSAAISDARRDAWRRAGGLLGPVAVAVALTVALVTVLSSGISAAQPPSRRRPPTDLVMQDADFQNLATMTRVRGFFVDNRLGHLAQALKVANSPAGAHYPVGTILQLVPQEAMVKRRKGFSAATHDWEFFSLQTTSAGTHILTRGTTQVVNRFGGQCASCHLAAESRFDLVCEHDHGCAPLPVGDDVIAAIQRADPRPVPMPRG